MKKAIQTIPTLQKNLHLNQTKKSRLFINKKNGNKMKKKEIILKEVKPSVAKTLKSKLIAAVHKVLKDNKAELTYKIEKVVNKSIKKIVKKTDKKILKAIEAT